MQILSELPTSRRVAWVEREWFWWVVRYQHRSGGVVMTVAARFPLRRCAQSVAAAMCGAHFDGASSVPRASAADRVRHAMEMRDFSNVTAAELREHGGAAFTTLWRDAEHRQYKPGYQA